MVVFIALKNQKYFLKELELIISSVKEWFEKDCKNNTQPTEDEIHKLAFLNLNCSVILYIIKLVKQYGGIYYDFLNSLKESFDKISFGEYYIYLRKGFVPCKTNLLGFNFTLGILSIEGVSKKYNIDKDHFYLLSILLNSVNIDPNMGELLNILETEQHILNYLQILTP